MVAEQSRSGVSLSFHGGTLLASGAWSGLELGALPGVLWDARVGSWRAPAADYPGILSALREVGAAGRNEIRRAWEVNSWPTEALSPPASELGLRPHQLAALSAWRAAGRRGVIALPTGSGKTRIAVAEICATRVPTIVLVPTRVLLQQWARELEGWLGVPVARLGDGQKQVGPVTVTTFESAYRRMSEIGDRFELLVVDEVHHFGRGQRDEALLMCVAPARLGLSATPPDDELQRERLERLMGPVCHVAGIAELVSANVLSPYRVETLQLPLNKAERADYQREYSVFARTYSAFARSFPQASWADFRAAALTSDSGRGALSAWLRARQIASYTEAKARTLAELLERFRQSKVLVFTGDNRTSYSVAAAHLVMPFTCDIGRKEREQTLDRFRSGALRVLVSSRVLNEGLDVPDAQVGIIVAGAHGERERVQRVGRLLRPSPGKIARIFDLVSSGTAEARVSKRGGPFSVAA